MNLTYIIFRSIRKAGLILNTKISNIVSYILLRGNNVKYGKALRSNGIPFIDVWNGGFFQIGRNFTMNNGTSYNVIGRQQKCIFVVHHNAKLIIGDNVGMSSTAITCTKSINIGNNVKIGGNCVFYDTDFHSLDFNYRIDPVMDKANIKQAPISIGENVFIGAHSTILKGVTIGKNSIIGAASLVAKSIPENQIWAGNPAKFIRQI